MSLGYFCSVALELERFGLRNASGPFDWTISEFDGVIEAINDRFAEYFEYDLLEQSKKYHQYYRNSRYKVQFFHDFNKYASLAQQLPSVEKKYKRRIERFYSDIKEPTLFIRYISDENKDTDGRSKELLWIEKNHEIILQSLKRFNPSNELVFWANDGVESKQLTIYHVPKDSGDTVARRPADKNKDIFEMLNSFDYPERESNIAVLKEKEKKKNALIMRVARKMRSVTQQRLQTDYIHNQQY